MRPSNQAPSRKVATREAALLALILAGSGVGIAFGSFFIPAWLSPFGDMTKEVGTTLIGLGVISVVWDLIARRAFMKEVIETVALADQVDDNGLQAIVWDYLLEIPWTSLFAQTDRLDIFVSYAQTWRRNNSSNLEAFLKKKTKLRVILPDPDDKLTMQELARRFNKEEDEVRSLILEAVKEYISLRSGAHRSACVECYFVASCPVTAIYLFASSGVVSFHSHQKKRAKVPTLMAEKGRPLYDFLRLEFDSLLARSRLAEQATLAPLANNDGESCQPDSIEQ
jgi:hypothetical protein